MVSLNLGSSETRFSDVNVDIRREAFKRHQIGNNVVADAGYLPFKAGVFSYVYASNVLEHLTVHPYDALNELGYVTKLGGIIHVISPTSNLRIMVNEAIIMPFLMLRYIKKKRFKLAYWIMRHFFLVRARLHGADSGFGGHRWLLPWGWKLFYRCWFFWPLRGWEGLHVLYEAYYVKNTQSVDGEEYNLSLVTEDGLIPYPDKHINYGWY